MNELIIVFAILILSTVAIALSANLSVWLNERDEFFARMCNPMVKLASGMYESARSAQQSTKAFAEFNRVYREMIEAVADTNGMVEVEISFKGED